VLHVVIHAVAVQGGRAQPRNNGDDQDGQHGRGQVAQPRAQARAQAPNRANNDGSSP
jgi:hypothetical protein